MGDSSLAGPYPGLHKELPIPVYLICEIFFSINLELVEIPKLWLAPSVLAVSQVRQWGPRPSAFINWHYFKFMPLAHFCLAQVSSSSKSIFSG